MKLIFLGDSTMQQNYANTYPQVGWPQALPLFILPTIKIMNFAHNGCSTKSFIDLGYFETAIKEVENGDYCFIQFGHNDAKIDNPMRYTVPYGSYYDNLCFFIDEIKKKGGIVILLTPIYRRFFDDKGNVVDNCHLDYPEAMKKVASDKNICLIDLCEQTKQLLQKLGDEGSKHLFMQFPPNVYPNYINGMQDNTHLRFDGAYEIAKMVIKEIVETKNSLRDIVKLEAINE